MKTGLQTNWVAYRTIALKEIRRFLRIWVQTILPAAITMGLYLIIFGGLIGPRIGEMAGYRYMDFIIPGVIMMSVITNSYANVVSSFFGAKFQRHIEELLISPIPNYVILLGYVSGGTARGLCVALAVSAVSLFFWDIQIHHIGVTIIVMVLTAMLFSLAGFINGIFAKTFDDISIIPTFVLTPLTYLGGVFYSIDLLPSFWQGASLLNPILYMVDAFRFGILGVSDINIWVAFAIIAGFIVALYSVCLALLKRGIGIRS
ncbi:MAG: ABC transporter permease [Gammaproteobacteria bacterium]